MATIPNNEVIVLPQHENTVVPLQDIDIVHLEVGPTDEIKSENPQPQVPSISTREEIIHCK